MDKYIDVLINESKKARKTREIPVSAIIIDKDGKIISKGKNNRQRKHKITGHAEILAIEKASKKLKDWRLNGYTLIVSLYPCKMCRQIIEESRINNIWYLLESEEKVVNSKIYKKIINKQKELEYRKILTDFFEEIR